ncbi:hypothetical protein RhiirB3_174752 [Rhizophagus irregularis]|nr:hypothetical protein RhiirB3_174752 [Rhizophagus irregularis]
MEQCGITKEQLKDYRRPSSDSADHTRRTRTRPQWCFEYCNPYLDFRNYKNSTDLLFILFLLQTFYIAVHFIIIYILAYLQTFNLLL